MSDYLNFSLEGKVALVTGASYGIGYAIASAYAKSGAKIVFCDIKQEFVDKGLASYKADGIDAKGHVKAMKKFDDEPQVRIYNLGTGKGYSVLQVLHAFEKACGKTLPYEIKPRRAGDIAQCYADPSKAKAELGWEAQYGIEEMCEDSWRWQSMNPNGYNE